MSKAKISSQSFVYPMPMCVVSVEVDGVINHMAVAWITRANLQPPMLTLTLNKHHHTNRGIHQNRAFGVSTPSVDQVREVDHVGLVSGERHDKSEVFEVFYGEVAHAPMIANCPYTQACRLVQVIDLPTHELFIGEIVETYCDLEAMSAGKPDIQKLRPFTLTMPDNQYWSVGPLVGKAWSAGKDYPKT